MNETGFDLLAVSGSRAEGERPALIERERLDRRLDRGFVMRSSSTVIAWALFAFLVVPRLEAQLGGLPPEDVRISGGGNKKVIIRDVSAKELLEVMVRLNTEDRMVSFSRLSRGGPAGRLEMSSAKKKCLESSRRSRGGRSRRHPGTSRRAWYRFPFEG